MIVLIVLIGCVFKTVKREGRGSKFLYVTREWPPKAAGKVGYA